MIAADALTVDPSPRLRALLAVKRLHSGLFESATDEALEEARALDRHVAAEVVSGLLDAFEPAEERPLPDRVVAASTTAQRAADVARVLRLSGAVPALVRCLDRLSDHDPVAHAALRALEALRVEATGPLLEAFRRSASPEERVLRAGALVRAGVRDGRVRVALCTLLDENPIGAANLLGEHGDRDAVPALLAALDRLELPAPETPGELWRCEEIVAIVQAVWRLKGRVSKAQRAKFDGAYAQSDAIWARGGPDADEPAPLTTEVG